MWVFYANKRRCATVFQIVEYINNDIFKEDANNSNFYDGHS